MGRNARRFAENFDRSCVAAVWERLLSGKSAEMHSISEYIETYGKKTDAVAVPKREEKPVVEMLSKNLRIAVILGKTGSPVHGVMDVNKVFDIDGAFATGTVTGFFNIAWGLAERGHTIDAFCECKENVAGSKLGGANFYNIDRETVSPTYDVYLSVNEAEMLRGKPKEALKITALWLNDFSYCQPEWDDHVDVYACPSETHRLYIRGRGEVPEAKLDMIPLCVSWELHDGALPRRPGSIAYCSSPDRGLHHLLAMFPEIKARVPGANLSVYYRLKPWCENIINDPALIGSHMRWRADMIRAAFQDLGEDGSRGLTLKGPVPPRMMARELRQTVVMAYPCDPVRFTEGFSAAVLDSCAAGCVPIIAGVDALPEVYGGSAHIISGNPGENKRAWIDAICLALTDSGFAAEVRADAKARARELSRPKVAAQWEKLIRERMARKNDVR
jgi:glycosyltransferase involved in cell wall biosynthesis